MDTQPATRRHSAPARGRANACAEGPGPGASPEPRAAGRARPRQQAAGRAREPLSLRGPRGATRASPRKPDDSGATGTHGSTRHTAARRRTVPPAAGDKGFQAEGGGTREAFHRPNRPAPEDAPSRSADRAREAPPRHPAPARGDAHAESAIARSHIATRRASRCAAATHPCRVEAAAPAKRRAAGPDAAAESGASGASERRTA